MVRVNICPRQCTSMHILHTVSESMLHKDVVQLMSTPISRCLPCVPSSLWLLEPRVGDNQPNFINPMYIQQLGEVFPSPSQNTVPVCNQITFLILYYISSRLVTLLIVTDAPTQVSNIFYLTVSFKVPKFSFQISLLLFLKCLLASSSPKLRISL